MPYLLCVLLLLSGTGTGSKGKSLAVPKYSPSYKQSSRDVGPLPGSHAPSESKTEFKRIYTQPAGLRLLVRANCDTPIARGELITRARQLTTNSGPVVQIDWEPIRGDRVSYWAVASAQRKIATHEMTPEKGKYVASEAKITAQEHWRVSRLSVKKTNCTPIKEVDKKNLRQAVINFLNNFTVEFFRRPSSQVSSSD